MSDLLYGEIENDLRASVRDVLGDKAPWTSVLAGTEKDEPYDAPLWRAVAGQLGCAGLPVPEELGGAGATWRETAVVMEELGRSAAPVPFLASAVIATAALLAAGERELLPRLAAGERIAVLAVPFSAAPGDVPATVRVADGTLTGEVTSVADGMAAEVLLVPAGDGLYAVDAADARRTAATSLDMTRRLADLAFSAAPARRVAEGAGAVRAALRTGAAMLASEQLGLAERCLDDTVAYVKTRYQFGRPVGSYQGLKHRLADLWTSITQARAVARHAASCVAAGDEDTPIAVAVAQAHCSAVALKAAEECVQMHGGIGFTWEHPAHLFLKRAKADSIALGTPDRHRALLAELVNLPPA
ncbi:acyl-CoA dehydrogenase family protein [Actinomadura citrea]|jgi:alkylation response protein AidB-like acyl-CoA dehydrogenase|uniref:Alkylation response protein AidB-like acyl-CoA dehydrogenase n=1 Tax=Actinomadura citrea TaxID=46158 RepID=A0A7Y9GC30_9ACTN|nr:acyl-CoA dehydrogenase family protein [Actinomadura citrea]NYE13774.1 alkylation response protein AidB-like acyl-CoA dehydrogenase [Actinomadura citrea]GGU04216.1 acyl-CoA dehydrogenase [Actinomadura citrea]